MTVGLIVNPHSGKANGRGLAVAGLLEGQANVMVRRLERFAQLSRHLDAFAAAKIETLYISSGDGTVHAIQTELAERQPFKTPPRLGLLAHGTTNMTAADLGLRVAKPNEQAAFIAANRIGEVAERATVKAVNPRDGKPRHGMFLGAGAVAQATRFTQRRVHGAGLKGDWASFATLAGAVTRALISRPRPGDQNRIDRPHVMIVATGGRTVAQGDQLMLIATTLDRLILGTRPFWGGKQGALRVTVFPYPLPSVVRWLVPLMYGGETRRVPEGALSFSCQGFEIETASDFVIDGEFFEAPFAEAMRIEAGPVFEYVRG
jgi:diacylglycerol kinase (ATP)